MSPKKVTPRRRSLLRVERCSPLGAPRNRASVPARSPKNTSDTWSGERLTRKQTASRHDNVWPQMSKHMSDAAKKRAKQKWAIEEPKLDNARQMRGIFFIEPDDEEFRLIVKNARRKLEVPMPAGMPCKTPVNCRGETCSSIGKRKTNNACIVDADESMRIRSEGVPQR